MPDERTERREVLKRFQGRFGDQRRRPRVVVVGAGVSGLTAAHELVERGFEVEVVDRFGRGDHVEVGGVARTQWAAVPLPGSRRVPWLADEEGGPGIIDWSMIRTIPPLRFPKAQATVRFVPPTAPQDTPELDGDSKTNVDAIVRRFLAHVHTWEGDWREAEKAAPTSQPPRLALRVSAYYDRGVGDAEFLAGRLVDAVVAWLVAVPPLADGGTASPPWLPRDRIDTAVIDVGAGPRGNEAAALEHVTVRVDVAQDIVPGEHGFRLFPAWYRHLLDTLGRIPLRQRGHGPRATDTGRRVLDNLRPNDAIQFALKGGQTFRLPRVRIRNLEEGRKILRNFFHKAGYRPEDVGRLTLRNLRYMTASSERREREYEEMTSAELLGGSGLGERVREHLNLAPELLVALDARDGDARSNGNIAVQMLLDQMEPGRRVDCTLNGPTSVAWFRHWREYLESQGVRFRRRHLRGIKVFDVAGLPLIVRPVFGPTGEHPGTPDDDPGDPGDHGSAKPDEAPLAPADYYVLALPPQRLAELLSQGGNEEFTGGESLRRLSIAADGEDNDIVRIQWFHNQFVDCRASRPKGPLRHMAGIQFFLDSDLKFVAGHHAYPDSAWGVTSVSQPQYWAERRRSFDGYRGLISAIITRWDEPGSDLVGRKPAWSCSPEELARETWHQISSTFPADEVRGLGSVKPLFFHVDRALHYPLGADGTHTKLAFNASPYLVNRVGDWKKRPGKPGDYRVHLGCLVFAGTLPQTFTRLTSMESANESARHAVNAILKHAGYSGQICQTWDPEENEVDDLRVFKELDRRLLARGARHVLDSPIAEAAIGMIPWRMVEDLAGPPEEGDDR